MKLKREQFYDKKKEFLTRSQSIRMGIALYPLDGRAIHMMLVPIYDKGEGIHIKVGIALCPLDCGATHLVLVPMNEIDVHTPI